MMSMRRYGQSLNYVKSSVNRQHLAPRATRCPIRHASETLSPSDAECLPVAAQAIIAVPPSVREMYDRPPEGNACSSQLFSATSFISSSQPRQRRRGYQMPPAEPLHAK